MADWIGRVVGNYRLDQQLGAGGMGQVFLGSHIHLQRVAAIKVLHAQFAVDPTFRARFLQEARAIASLSHPHIVGVLDFGEQDGHFYLVMEPLSDGSLRTLRRSYGEKAALPLPLALDLLRQAASGLAHAHAQSFVHRDIKPDNLLLRRDAQQAHGWLLKITDFGLVRLNDGGVQTQTGVTMGTPAYMSPEQCQGIPLDGRSDVYSLGVVLFESVTGRAPFEVRSLSDAVFRHVYTPPPSPLELRPDLPQPLVDLILRCLAKNPDERFPDASGLRLALEELIARQPTQPGSAAGGVVGASDPTVLGALSPSAAPPTSNVPTPAPVITTGWVYTPVVEPDLDAEEPAPPTSAALSAPPYSTPPVSHPSAAPSSPPSSPPPSTGGAALSQPAASQPPPATPAPGTAAPVAAQPASKTTRTRRARTQAGTGPGPGTDTGAQATPASAAPPIGAPTVASASTSLHGSASAAPTSLPPQPALRSASAAHAPDTGHAAGQRGAAPPPPPSTPAQPRAADDAGSGPGGGSGRLAAFALVGVLVLVLATLGIWQLTRSGGGDDGDGDDNGAQGGIVATDTVASGTGTGTESGSGSGGSGTDATATTGISADDAAATNAVRAATAAVVPSEASANPGDAGDPTATSADPGSGTGEGEPTATPEDEVLPASGPIVFATSRDSGDGTLDLWTMAADGQAQAPLITLPHDDWSPAWSPDGSLLAWSNKTDGQHDDIWIADADGTDARQVTGDTGDDKFPTWSPDGTRILFVRTTDGADEIYVYNLTNGVEEQLTYNNAYDGYAQWSPDGTRMAWTSSASGNNDIWLMEADTGSYALTYEAASDFSPIWAAGGEHIIFISDRYGNQDIFVMDANGSNQQPITSTAENEWYPRLSPDQTMLAFIRQTGDASQNSGDLVIVSLTEGNEWVIANNVLAHDPGLVWAPDGSGLLFQHESSDTYVDLWWATLSGGAPVQLTNSALYDGGASWRGAYPSP